MAKIVDGIVTKIFVNGLLMALFVIIFIGFFGSIAYFLLAIGFNGIWSYVQDILSYYLAK